MRASGRCSWLNERIAICYGLRLRRRQKTVQSSLIEGGWRTRRDKCSASRLLRCVHAGGGGGQQTGGCRTSDDLRHRGRGVCASGMQDGERQGHGERQESEGSGRGAAGEDEKGCGGDPKTIGWPRTVAGAGGILFCRRFAAAAAASPSRPSRPPTAPDGNSDRNEHRPRRKPPLAPVRPRYPHPRALLALFCRKKPAFAPSLPPARTARAPVRVG